MHKMQWTWEEDIFCPNSHQCPEGLVSFDIGKVPNYLNIISSTFSCLGSILLMITYLKLRRSLIRSPAQTIVTLLAIADFLIHRSQ